MGDERPEEVQIGSRRADVVTTPLVPSVSPQERPKTTPDLQSVMNALREELRALSSRSDLPDDHRDKTDAALRILELGSRQSAPSPEIVKVALQMVEGLPGIQPLVDSFRGEIEAISDPAARSQAAAERKSADLPGGSLSANDRTRFIAKSLQDDLEKKGFYDVRRLAEGGMGVIFSARQRARDGTSRRVVVKTVKRLLGASPEDIASLRAEQGFFLEVARAHPGFPTMVSWETLEVDLGERERFLVPYYVMELIEGPSVPVEPRVPSFVKELFHDGFTHQDLLQVVRHLQVELGAQFPMEIWHKIEIYLTLIAAKICHFMDGKSVIHQDVKPDNEFILQELSNPLVEFINMVYAHDGHDQETIKRAFERVYERLTQAAIPLKVSDPALWIRKGVPVEAHRLGGTERYMPYQSQFEKCEAADLYAFALRVFELMMLSRERAGMSFADQRRLVGDLTSRYNRATGISLPPKDSGDRSVLARHPLFPELKARHPALADMLAEMTMLVREDPETKGIGIVKPLTPEQVSAAWVRLIELLEQSLPSKDRDALRLKEAQLGEKTTSARRGWGTAAGILLLSALAGIPIARRFRENSLLTTLKNFDAAVKTAKADPEPLTRVAGIKKAIDAAKKSGYMEDERMLAMLERAEEERDKALEDEVATRLRFVMELIQRYRAGVPVGAEEAAERLRSLKKAEGQLGSLHTIKGPLLELAQSSDITEVFRVLRDTEARVMAILVSISGSRDEALQRVNKRGR